MEGGLIVVKPAATIFARELKLHINLLEKKLKEDVNVSNGNLLMLLTY